MNIKYVLTAIILLIILVLGGAYVSGTFDTGPLLQPIVTLPSSCIDEQEGFPVITAISTLSASVGDSFEVSGCNFSGFEGDKTAWLENNLGVKGILYSDMSSTSKLMKFTIITPLCQEDTSYSGLPCDAELSLAPGEYSFYTTPWGKKSNEVTFTIE